MTLFSVNNVNNVNVINSVNCVNSVMSNVQIISKVLRSSKLLYLSDIWDGKI